MRESPIALFASSSAYENFMGRYSRQLAHHFADFAGVSEGYAVADVGAGTGALSAALVGRGASVAAADPSPGLVAAIREQLPAVDAHEGPAEALPWSDHAFDAALAQLVVSFMSDAHAGVAEMRRVVRPGGTVAVCMWDRDGMEMLTALKRTREAVSGGRATIDQDLAYRTREEIEPLFGDGFTDVTTELLEVESTYSGYDELWSSVLGGSGPAGAWVVSLDEREREAVRTELHRQVGEPDGPFTLRGQAWATRASKA